MASEVWVNGVRAGTIWCSPWQIDVTGLLKEGKNLLEIRTVNNWTNRLIRDASLPEKERVTWTTVSIAKPDDKLQSSGLINAKLSWFKK
jgi:hypothetical protein